MEIQVKANKELIGQCLPDDIKYHLKKYVSPADYGFVAHQNKISLGTVDRIFRNNEPIPVSERSYPAIEELIQIALERIENENADAKVSKKTLKAILGK